VGRTLVSVGGGCGGRDDYEKPGRYPPGTLSRTLAFDLVNRARGWFGLPDLPGEPRQGAVAAAVDGVLYIWGGYSKTPADTFKDGFRLSNHGGRWEWQRLPDLPWPLTVTGAAVIDAKIYVVGGADFGRLPGSDEPDFFTEMDRNHENHRLGARTLVFDTQNPVAGWQHLPECPGTARWGHATTGVAGNIYVFGGIACNANPEARLGYLNAVDNWIFDPRLQRWERIRDLPVSGSAFQGGSISFENRYVILVGGYPYAKIACVDGTVAGPYGVMSQASYSWRNPEHAVLAKLYNCVWVYDIVTDLFGFADPLPINNHLATIAVRGQECFLWGGETGGGFIDGEYYGHHPDLFLVGQIKKLSWQASGTDLPEAQAK
jgi:Kelch motif